jgi:two-component system chemotaxis sensor kinase CheA
LECGNFDEDPALCASGAKLLAGLQVFLNAGGNTEVAQFSAPQKRFESIGGGALESGNWHLSLRFGVDSFRNGMDPLAFIQYLSSLGEIVNLTTISASIPDVKTMDPESCYLGFSIDVKTDVDKAALENVFEFVREDSQIIILPHESSVDELIGLINSLPEDEAYLGELLLKSGLITQRELEAGLLRQKQEVKDSQPAHCIGEILVAQQVVQQPLINAALDKQKQNKEIKTRENQSIRVDSERLDKLIDLIGELVISTAAANLLALQAHDQAMQEANADVIGLVEQVRDSALQLRMVPIGPTFSKFQRVVRDVSQELGKQIKLEISGAETEVDKSVVEKIGDPLMHLVRNAMDHGIEQADVRYARGKPAEGLIRLNAYHRSGSLVIEVSDDGGGLNRDKILAKAMERGLAQPGQILNDQEIFALIFEPGFSTVDLVSNLSGRGVGMDVVKRNITDLRGVINIDSSPGLGTRIKLQLPLTLAIIAGFLVGVGETSYVIPLDRVVECVELNVDDHHDYMELRGEVLPFIRLRKVFRQESQPTSRQNIVVVEHLGQKAGLVVDRLMGELQTVIKPLGNLFRHVEGVGGSTILGSGEVALIIDVATLLK